jgi:hypothetical protein
MFECNDALGRKSMRTSSLLSLLCSLAVCLVACTDTSPPAWPAKASLSVKQQGKSWVILSWPEAQDNNKVASYRIIKGVKETASLGPTARSYKLEGLDDLSTYGLYVQATDQVGNRSTSLGVTITTLDGSVPTWPDEKGLKIEMVMVKGARRAKFSWTAAVDKGPIKSYRLAKDGSLMAEIAGDETGYLYQGSDYPGAYTLEAIDESGNKSAALSLEVKSGHASPAAPAPEDGKTPPGDGKTPPGDKPDAP